jgi:hypothetical protein
LEEWFADCRNCDFSTGSRTISSQLVFPPQIVILSGAKDLHFGSATALPGSNESVLVSNARSAVLTAGVHLCRISSQTQTGGTMKLNKTRVWMGGIAGGVVWTAWSFFVGMRQAPLYEAMQKQGLFLKEPRYPFFTHIWIVLIFVMSILIAHLYAWARATAGPGPKTALKIGMIVGFCAGVPGNFAQATWSPIPRLLPLGWMLDLWIGSILAAVVAGFLYKE